MATVSDAEDRDGDGWTAGEDCDDGRDDIYPGAPEVLYDGVDQDCDGGDLIDGDGDGYPATLAGGNDCADGDAETHPSADEVCGDGVDQDCNEAVDDGCAPALTADPGGFAWVCGPSVPATTGWVLLGAVVWIGLRSRG